MTQLQLEYQKLQEQKRANLASEDIRSREATVKEREATQKELETTLKEMKAPYEIQDLIASANMNDAHTSVYLEEVTKLVEEVRLTAAKTELTQAQKETAAYDATMRMMDVMHRMSGIMYAGDIEETMFDWIDTILGGVGKGLGALIG